MLFFLNNFFLKPTYFQQNQSEEKIENTFYESQMHPQFKIYLKVLFNNKYPNQYYYTFELYIWHMQYYQTLWTSWELV